MSDMKKNIRLDQLCMKKKESLNKTASCISKKRIKTKKYNIN